MASSRDIAIGILASLSVSVQIRPKFNTAYSVEHVQHIDIGNSTGLEGPEVKNEWSKEDLFRSLNGEDKACDQLLFILYVFQTGTATNASRKLTEGPFCSFL